MLPKIPLPRLHLAPERRRLGLWVICSVLFHVLALGGVVWVRDGEPRLYVKRGEALFVDIAPDRPEEKAPRGNPAEPVGPEQEAGPAPAPKPPPRLAEAPRPRAPRPPAARPAPARPAPRAPQAPSQVARAEPEVVSPPRAVEPAPAAAPVRPPEPAPARSPEPAPAPAGPAEPAPTPARTPEPAPAPARAPEAAPPGAVVAAPGPGPEAAPAPPGPGERTALAEPRPVVPPGILGRRGGGGGLREGRGGVEGDPIPLDTKEPRYQDYFNRIREKIKANWVYPREAGERGIEGNLNIEFGIARDGHLRFIDLTRSSGVDVLDRAALNAVKLAQPFPEVPEALAKEVLAINGHFVYRIVDEGTALVKRFR